MKKIIQNSQIISRIVFFMFLLISNSSYAQTGFDDDVVDVPAAPIDDFVIISIIIAIVVMFVFLKSIRDKQQFD